MTTNTLADDNFRGGRGGGRYGDRLDDRRGGGGYGRRDDYSSRSRGYGGDREERGYGGRRDRDDGPRIDRYASSRDDRYSGGRGERRDYYERDNHRAAPPAAGAYAEPSGSTKEYSSRSYEDRADDRYPRR